MTGIKKSNIYHIITKLTVLAVIFTVEKSRQKCAFFSTTTDFEFLGSIKFILE